MENRGKLYTVSNGLSFLRLLMAIPMIILIINGMTWYAIGLGVLAIVTDLLDGYLARKLDQVSDWGKIIDPLADKVFVAGAFLAMLTEALIPLWFGLIIIGRDVIILIAGLFLSSKVKTIPMSNYAGKAAVLMIAQSMLLALLKQDSLMPYSMALALAGVALSLGSYSVNLTRMMKNVKEKS